MSATLPSASDPTVPLDTGRKTSRKQWSVQGGPRGLLRRMRSQLAEDGCPESQLVMGRTLLQQLGEDSETDEEDARLAVFWLNQASLQGNTEATDLLQDCLNRNIGICEHNYREIRECLAMDLQEKLARRAAHLLFCSLSDGNDFVNSGSLNIKIQNLVDGKEGEKSIENVQENSGVENCEDLEERYGGERFTEDHLVSSSVLYCEGRVPPLHHYITPAAHVDQSQIIRIVNLPIRLTVEVYRSCLHFLGVVLTNFFIRILNLRNPFSSIALLCLAVTMIALLGTIQAHIILPVVVSCISLTVMMVASAHMLLIRRRFDSFRMWSVIFGHYCPDLNTTKIENKFKARCWKPYVVMFVGLFFYLGAVPLTSSKLLINFLPSLYLFSALTFFLVPERLNVWQFISLSIHLAAVNPEICNTLSVWLLPFARGTGLEDMFAIHHIYLSETVKLNLGIASLLHAIWCCCCIGVLLKHGVTFLLPHLVSLTWCHLAVMGTPLVTVPSSLVNPLATWSLLVVLPFATPIVLTAAPGLLIASLCLQIGFELYIAGLMLAASIALTWLLKNWWPSFTLICKVILGGGILIGLLQSSMVQRLPTVQHSNLLWENYKNTCWPTKDTGALTVHRCLPLQGTFVKWRGSVTQVEIVSVWNLPQTALSLLPQGIEKPLRCYLGKRLGPCLSSKAALGQNEHCHVIQSALGSDTCTLDNWNEYTFEATVSMSSSSWKFGVGTSLVKIHADNDFRDFALGLQLGDEIEFIGSLSKNVDSQNPRIQLSSITCINCKLKLKSANKHTLHSQFDLWLVPTFIFNFLMGPILTI